MDFFENMKDCLLAVQNPKPDIRRGAEQEIRNLRDTDPRKFMATLTREIANEALPTGSRQMACIIFKNFIINRSKDSKYENYWINLAKQFKEQIKEAILATLASNEVLVRNQVSVVISAIASIEIPRGEWDALIPNLCVNAEHTIYNIRLASLTTLGYICEEIHPEDINDALKNSIIVALTNNIATAEEEASRLATKAMIYSVPFSSQNFKVQQERDYIMDRLFQACQSQNEEIVENALHCIRELTTQEYECMQFYFNRICEATSVLAKHPSPKVGAQAYEYWTTLVEDETERVSKGVMCMGYIRGCYENLLQMILQGICMVSFEEDDEDEDWGHSLSAACCLQKLSILIGNDIMDTVVGFAAQYIQSPDWKLRYAACISLGSITEGPEK